MPGFLLHVGAVTLCAHGGQAQPIVPNLRVKVMGQPIATQAIPYSVSGCPLTGIPPSPPPCVLAQWITGSLRVKAMGQPVLLADSNSVCTPTGTPLSIVLTQVRVKGM